MTPLDTPSSSSSAKWEGRWEQLTGRVKSAWGDMTDNEIAKAEGDYDQLVGFIKEKYGESTEEVERRINQDEEV